MVIKTKYDIGQLVQIIDAGGVVGRVYEIDVYGPTHSITYRVQYWSAEESKTVVVFEDDIAEYVEHTFKPIGG